MPNLAREQSSIPIEEDNDDSWIPLQPSQNEKQIVPHSLTTQVIQRRLETRITLKRNLVDHPIDLFWKRYLINVLKEKNAKTGIASLCIGGGMGIAIAIKLQ